MKEDVSFDLPSVTEEFDYLTVVKVSDKIFPNFKTSKSLAFWKKNYERLSDGSVETPFVGNYWDSSISSSGSGNVIIEENCKCPQIMVVDDNPFNM